MSNTTQLEKTIIKNNQDSFHLKVENLVWEHDISYLEAVQMLSEDMNIEYESVGKFISSDLYSKLEIEAENLYLLKTKKNRLDI